MRHSLFPRLAAAPAFGTVVASMMRIRRPRLACGAAAASASPTKSAAAPRAMIAGIGTPWGFASGDGNLGYHLVWSRDMYKFANALITAGDSASAASAVNWLFNRDIEPNAGRFPQNAFVNGTPFRDAVQMDEQAMPIVLAYRLGPAVYNPVWPQIQKSRTSSTARGPGPSRSVGRKRAATRPRRLPRKSPVWSTPLRSRSRTTTPPTRRTG